VNEPNPHEWASSFVRWRIVGAVLVLSTLVTTAFLYQQKADAAWAEIPPEVAGDLEALEARLSAIESFLEEHPLWIRAHRAQSERTRLSTDLHVLRTERLIDDMRAQEEHELALGDARAARQRGIDRLQVGDRVGALRELESALVLAPEGWTEADQIRRDIEALRTALDEGEEP
jgi:hypothetical protein